MDIRYQLKIIHCSLRETFVSEDARIVNQNINTTPTRHRLSDHVFYLRQIGDIGTVRHRFAAHRFDLSNHRQRCR